MNKEHWIKLGISIMVGAVGTGLLAETFGIKAAIGFLLLSAVYGDMKK